MAESRFWSKVDQTGTCWLWTAYVHPSGYGQFYWNGRQTYAHRASYEIAHGPIPAGMEIDHRATCPRNCVRPEHLRLATRKQNVENRTGAQTNSKSGVRGVRWNKCSWVAEVKHHGVLIHVGRFPTLAEAEVAVIAKRNELFTHNDLDRMTNV
jgi:hypothetical protein